MVVSIAALNVLARMNAAANGQPDEAYSARTGSDRMWQQYVRLMFGQEFRALLHRAHAHCNESTAGPASTHELGRTELEM